LDGNNPSECVRLIRKAQWFGQPLALAGACLVWVLAAQPVSAGSDRYSANEKNVEMAKVEQPFNWTGFYLGGNVGGSWTSFDYNQFDTDVDVGRQFNELVATFEADEGVDFASFRTPGRDSTTTESSLIGGGQLGYNHQFGHFVVGVEGDFQGLSASNNTQFFNSTVASVTEGGFFPTSTTLTSRRMIDTNWQASARLRLGYTAHRVLLYVTGGAVWLESTARTSDVATTDIFDATFPTPRFFGTFTDTNTSKDDHFEVGWTAGGGAEWAFTDIASIGLEYRHNGFGDQTYNFDGHRTAIFPGSQKINIDSDQVTFRVNILLGHVGN
jgi:outer membrane immunogenic protein